MIYMLIRVDDHGFEVIYTTESVWTSLAVARVAMAHAYAALGPRAEEYPDEVTFHIEAWETNSGHRVRIVRD